MLRRFLFSLSFVSLFIGSALMARPYTDTLKFLRKKDSVAYIVKYKNPMLQHYLAIPGIDLSITDLKKIGKKITYRPNVRTSMGLGAVWKGFYLTYSVRLAADSLAAINLGETTYQDFQFGYNRSRWGLDTYYQNYQGFYLNNPFDFDSLWAKGQPNPQRHDLQTQAVGLNVFYIHSPKFSWSAAFSQTQRQRKSAGSLLFLLSNVYSSIYSDSSIIPKKELHLYPLFSYVKNATFYNITMAPGYAYTLTKYSIFVTVAIYMGGGIEFQQYNIDGHINKVTQLAFKMNGRFALGYNGHRFNAGMYSVADNSFMAIRNAYLNLKTRSFCFYVGYRFL